MEKRTGLGFAVRVRAMLLRALGIPAAAVPTSDTSVPFPAQTRASGAGAGAAALEGGAVAAGGAVAEEAAAVVGRQRRRGGG